MSNAYDWDESHLISDKTYARITEREDTAEPWVYSHTGWSAHNSGAGPRRYWLACYASGKQVGTYDSSMGFLIRFKSYDSALRRAKQLNRELGIA